MNHKLEVYLTKKYPKLFRDMYGDPKKTCLAWGVQCGDGWFFLLNTLCASIQEHIDHLKTWRSLGQDVHVPTQVVFQQVKEKFGALYIYYEGGDDYIKNIISFTKRLSTYICENCGRYDEFVGQTRKGWIQSLCTDCAKEYGKDIKTQKDLIKLMDKVRKCRTNPKRAWKGMDEPLNPEDLIPPCDRYKIKKRKK